MKGDRWVNSCTVHEHENEHEGCMCVHDPKLGFNGYMYICLHVLHVISIPPPYTLIAFMFAHTKPHLGEIPYVQPYFPTCQHVHMATLRNKRLGTGVISFFHASLSCSCWDIKNQEGHSHPVSGSATHHRAGQPKH